MDDCTGFVTVGVPQTFISSDFLTPSARTRVTLPGIARFVRPIRTKELNCWGAVTVHSTSLPRRDVTAFKYGSGCFNYYAPYQPYRVTALRLSHCRKNDQLLCPPEKGYLIHENKLQFECPRDKTDTSHISKLSIFPQPFCDLPNKNDVAIADRDKGLQSLQHFLYVTTSHKESYRNYASEATSQSSHSNKSTNSTQICLASTPCLMSNAFATEGTAGNYVSDEYAKATGKSKTKKGLQMSYEEGHVERSANDNSTLTMCQGHSMGVQTDECCLRIECFADMLRKDYSHQANHLMVNCTNTTTLQPDCYDNQNENMKDAATQTMLCVSIVRELPYMPTPHFCKPFPPLPCLSDVEGEATQRSQPIATINHYQRENWSTTRFKAHLQYNEKYGSITRVGNIPNKQDGKRMYFYGEHTSIFR